MSLPTNEEELIAENKLLSRDFSIDERAALMTLSIPRREDTEEERIAKERRNQATIDEINNNRRHERIRLNRFMDKSEMAHTESKALPSPRLSTAMSPSQPRRNGL